jgi:hypothetical protein
MVTSRRSRWLRLGRCHTWPNTKFRMPATGWCRHEVDVAEVLLAPAEPRFRVGWPQRVVAEHGPRRHVLAALAVHAGPLHPDRGIHLRRLRPSAVHREVQRELTHLLACEVAAGERGIDVVVDRSGRVGRADARQRDQATVASREPGT